MLLLPSSNCCSNVLLSDDQRACLADLGFAQVLGNAACTAKGGSRLYAAPEQLMGARCTLAADVYSFGILLVELTTQQVVRHRGDWRLPQTPQQCTQMGV
jgi:serine/threonine protein kinase